MQFITSVASIAALALVSTSVSAQTCSNTVGAVTFAQCVRNALTDPNGAVGPTSAFAACDALKGNNNEYFGCLCSKNQAIVGCYSNFCAADTSLASYNNAVSQYCGAVVPVTATVSPTPNAGLSPLATFSAPAGSTPTSAAKASPSASPSQKTNAGESVSVHASLVFGSAVLGLGAALVAL